MRARPANDSPSLRLRAASLEQQLDRRHRSLRLRITGIKQAVIMKWTAPVMLLTAFGAGVVLEQTSHRRSGTFTRILNSGYAGARLLEALLLTMRIANQGFRPNDPEHVQPD